MEPTLEQQIGSASRSVEEARRIAYHDTSRIGALVEQISVLADLRQKEGDFRKAESLYREALFRAQESRKTDYELQVGILSLLAHLYDRWGKTDQSLEFYEKALHISETRGLDGGEASAIIKNNLAMIYKHRRDYEKAERCYQESLHAFQKLEGEHSSRVASLYNNLGVLYYAQLEIDRALEMHEKALAIRQHNPVGPIDPADLSQTYINLAAVYKATGDFKRAEASITRAKQLRASINGHHPAPRRAATLLIDKNL
ncbi:MAG: tetratricopeptide repeat protein [Verrucomicrobiaceae bacterium]|nr:tetratricopeptide repeat protein [Verrucomicrobiaceae bacterium]